MSREQELLRSVQSANRDCARQRVAFWSAPADFVGPLVTPDAAEWRRMQTHRQAIAKYLGERTISAFRMA